MGEWLGVSPFVVVCSEPGMGWSWEDSGKLGGRGDGEGEGFESVV